MKLSALTLMFTLLTAIQCFASSPKEAQAIIDEYNRELKSWVERYRAAKTLQDVSAVEKARPKAEDYGERMRKLIGGHINKGWTIPYQAWLLETHPKFFKLPDPKTGSKLVDYEHTMMRVFNKNHLKDPLAGRFCMALALSLSKTPHKEFNRMQLCEHVYKNHSDKKQRGMAAMAMCILLDTPAKGPVIAKRRLALLKYAGLHAFDEKVGERTIGDYAQDDLYRINNLEVGRKAPEIKGIDSAFKKHKLSDYKGKVVMLLFWDSQDSSGNVGAKEYAKQLNKMIEKRAGQNFTVIGVNSDHILQLRKFQGDGEVTWKNFSDPKREIFNQYRVNSTPYCFVIDGEGIINYVGPIGAFADLSIDVILK